MSFFTTLALRAAFGGPWAGSAWISYYRSLFKKNPPPDLALYTDQLQKNLAQDRRIDALHDMIFASKVDIAREVPQLKSPVLSIMGSSDPDFPDATAENHWIEQTAHAKRIVLPDLGHYPHLEEPMMVSGLIINFIDSH